MDFTQNEIAAMRNILACNGVVTLARKLGYSTRMDEGYQIIAEELGISYNSARNYCHKGPARKHANSLSKLAFKYGVIMYPYQFAPTTAICLAWLEFDYRCDRGKHVSKRQFKYWDRNMSGAQIVREEEFA